MTTRVVHKLKDYLLLNAYSLNSNGLINGKAGISLCLFELSQYLHDESLEDKAFELLQESLALSSKGDTINFEAGLSGIGFVLLYLIENRMLDADYEDLFDEQNQKILSQLLKQSDFSVRDLSYVYFLELLSSLVKKEETCVLIDKIFADIEKSLCEQLETFDSINSGIPKLKVLTDLDAYFKALYQCKKNPALSLIKKYTELYEKGKIASLFSTGCYLENLDSSGDFSCTIRTIKENAFQNIHPASLSLSQRIDLSYLLTGERHLYQKQIELLEQDLFDFSNPDYEKHLIQLILNRGLLAGYGSGIARLLLYWVYRENKRNGSECSRFKYIF